MFKRKINLKKARKLTDCVPESIRQEAKCLSKGYNPIVSLDMPILKLNDSNKNLRNYPHLNDKSTW